MPIETTVTHNIVCGNPRCPGNQLDPTDRVGWTFVSLEIYGQPTTPQRVFCSFGCLSVFANAVEKGLVEWIPPAPEINPEVPSATRLLT